MESSLIHRKFEKACSKYPDKPALIFQEDNRFFKLTFSQVLDYSGRITGLLKEYGLSFSQRVAIYMENNPFWFSAYLGIVSAGLTAVPMDYMLSKDEVTNILIDSESKVVFCSRNSIKDLQGLDTPFLKDLKIVCLDSDFIKGLKINNQSLLDFDQESIASLLYTSGTTDNPKAVCLSHKNLMTNFADIYKLGFYGDKDIFLCILPLHHAYPFMVNLLVPLFVGSSVVLPKSLRAKDILFCLRRQGVSIFVGVPQVFSLIYQNLCQKLKAFEFIIKVLGNLRSKTGINISKAVFFFVHRKFGRSLRFLVCGGAKLDEKIAAGFFNLGFDIMEGYGLTETSPVVSFNPPKKAKIGSVGKPLISVAVRIHNPNRQGQGEILVKGGSVTKGYFRKPHLTAESLKDGWFFTKDIGYLDKDNYLYITGRKDECIVLSSGKNIWPKELEQVYASRPSIKEICIFNRLDHLYAVVVPDKSYFTKAEALDYHGRIKKDIEEVSLNLAPYKRISGLKIVFDELPRTRLGKLKRFAIKKMYSQPEADEKDFAFGDVLSGGILGAIEKFLGRRVSLNDNLELDLGVDSLLKLQLISMLEKMLRISIPDEDLPKIVRVDSLVNYIKLRRPQDQNQQSKAHQLSWAQILNEKPAFKLLRRIRLKPLLFDILFCFLGKAFLFSLFKLVYRVKIEGLENIPEKGPFLVCPNHASFFDGPLIFATFPFKYMSYFYFMGLSNYFEHPALSWLVKPGRIIPVDANKNLKLALTVSSFLLKLQKSLCIFPEGLRSTDGSLKEFKKGVGILSWELKVRIIPCAIVGTYEAWPVARMLPGISKFRIIYGKPIEPGQLKDLTPDPYATITNLLRQRVDALLQAP